MILALANNHPQARARLYQWQGQIKAFNETAGRGEFYNGGRFFILANSHTAGAKDVIRGLRIKEIWNWTADKHPAHSEVLAEAMRNVR